MNRSETEIAGRAMVIAEGRVVTKEWWLPSLGALALLVPIGLLYWQLGGPSALLTDPINGLQVRTGLWIVGHHAVPRIDLFSFAIAGRKWCDWEWLSDVIYAILWLWHGLAAVAALSMAILCATSVIVYLTARVDTSSVVALGVTCLVMAATTIHWLARPHLFTWLFVAGFCWVIERSRAGGKSTPLFALPLLMLLWVNLHPGFVAGLMIVAIWWAAELAEARFSACPEERTAHRKRSQALALAGAACLCVALVNPYGIGLDRHIIAYLTSPRSVTAHVVEWLSPDFHNPRLQWVELLLPLGGAAGLWQGWRGRWAWCALTIAWMHLALVSVRNVPIFAIVCVAPLASLAEELLKRRGWASRLRAVDEVLPRSRSATRACCGMACTFLMAVTLSGSLRLGPPSSLPVQAFAQLPPGRLFTTDRWADYLVYAMPGRKVFFDGRNDLYGEGLVREYLTMMQAKPGWRTIARKYAFAVALVPAQSAIAAALESANDWRLSYRDSIALIFVRSN